MSLKSISLSAMLLGAASLSLAIGTQPAIANTTSAIDLMLPEDNGALQSDNLGQSFSAQPSSDTVEVAQSRRRGASTASSGGSNFIGLGASFGYVDDISGVVISKISIDNQWSVRPSVSIGDNIAVLVPITYEFNTLDTNVGGARVSPYAGLGASWANENNNEGNEGKSDLHLLVAAGVDVPLSDRFVLNAQANLGLFNDTEFGGTIGVGYSFDNIFR